MTNDEILQAAKEAGFSPNRSYTNIPITGYSQPDLSDQIKAFAAIIEKRTIERCAVVCENIDSLASSNPPMLCAAAIRKLGEQ